MPTEAPTATPFTSLGVGNGFASCAGKVNVKDFDYWTTLSGVNKDDPDASDELIKESLNLAMKLFWNLNGITGKAGYSSAPAITVDLDEGLDEGFDGASWYEVNTDPQEYVTDVNKLPHERVCYSEWSAYTGFEVEDGVPSDGVRMAVNIYRMYDGDISSETNFVGYGGASFAWVSPWDFTSFSLSSSVISDTDESSAYVEFNGMHFVGYMDAYFSEDETKSITGGTTATATVTYQPSGGGSESYTLATLSSPTFYTYST
tara:strand:+ start:1900 stop:2679 length:780 start_codon:yes stop_codon:yes gene_type:complete